MQVEMKNKEPLSSKMNTKRSCFDKGPNSFGIELCCRRFKDKDKVTNNREMDLSCSICRIESLCVRKKYYKKDGYHKDPISCQSASNNSSTKRYRCPDSCTYTENSFGDICLCRDGDYKLTDCDSGGSCQFRDGSTCTSKICANCGKKRYCCYGEDCKSSDSCPGDNQYCEYCESNKSQSDSSTERVEGCQYCKSIKVRKFMNTEKDYRCSNTKKSKTRHSCACVRTSHCCNRGCMQNSSLVCGVKCHCSSTDSSTTSGTSLGFHCRKGNTSKGKKFSPKGAVFEDNYKRFNCKLCETEGSSTCGKTGKKSDHNTLKSFMSCGDSCKCFGCKSCETEISSTCGETCKSSDRNASKSLASCADGGSCYKSRDPKSRNICSCRHDCEICCSLFFKNKTTRDSEGKWECLACTVCKSTTCCIFCDINKIGDMHSSSESNCTCGGKCQCCACKQYMACDCEKGCMCCVIKSCKLQPISASGYSYASTDDDTHKTENCCTSYDSCKYCDKTFKPESDCECREICKFCVIKDFKLPATSVSKNISRRFSLADSTTESICSTGYSCPCCRNFCNCTFKQRYDSSSSPAKSLAACRYQSCKKRYTYS